jgi:serine/threonine protein phosphatase PrpC
MTHFASQPADAFFAVYDGHGRDGEKCALFARDMLPDILAKVIKEMKMEQAKSNSNDVVEPFTDVELGKAQVQDACTKSHLMVNAAMRGNGTIDDTLSGTTAVSAYFQGRLHRVTISNVGDSRAVLGRRLVKDSCQEENGNGAVYKAIPLSRDQTPHSRGERKRVRDCGARILSLDQIEGLEPIRLDKFNDHENGDDDHEHEQEYEEDEDPPRVWHPTMDYPGTAFTRSLGDALAKELGVIADPEMVTMELEQGDEIIVLATDGVFEFLTNQSVIDICAKFQDPLEACRAVICQSYQLWLQYELRTDDITMICIFIDGINKETKESFQSNHSLHHLALDGSDSIIFDSEKEAKDENKVKKRCAEIADMLKESLHRTPNKGQTKLESLQRLKSDEEKEVLNQAMKRSLILQNVTPEQLDMIHNVMQPVHVKKGDWIIHQGEEGNCLYIAEHGKFEVRLNSKRSSHHGGVEGGKLVHVYEASKEKKMYPCFGELSLLYSSPRAATVIAVSDGKLWSLHRDALKAILTK